MTNLEFAAEILWPIFLPFSYLYCMINKLRSHLYKRGIFKSHKLPGYTISVGNLEVGGTGKSPIVIDLCDELLKEEKKVVILTRGYKSGLNVDDSCTLLNEEMIQAPQSKKSFFADEARMQSAKLKGVYVVIGQNRWQAAQRFMHEFGSPDYWILEDGFQHLKIKRDFDLVLLDDKYPLSKRALCLPSGRLREGVSALKRADHVLFTRDRNFENKKLKNKLNKWNIPFHPVEFFMDKPISIDEKRYLGDEEKFSLVLGIAKPEQVIKQLIKWRTKPIRSFILPDHGEIPESQILIEIEKGRKIVTTEKDYHRHKTFFSSISSKTYVLRLHTNFKTQLLRLG